MELWERTLNYFANLSFTKIAIWGLALAVAFELITVFFRFGMGMVFTRDSAFLATFTLGLRIHHGYVGVAIALLALCIPAPHAGTRSLLAIVAIAFILSDVIHHFLVLWPLTGSPEFDLRYPPPPDNDAGG